MVQNNDESAKAKLEEVKELIEDLFETEMKEKLETILQNIVAKFFQNSKNVKEYIIPHIENEITLYSNKMLKKANNNKSTKKYNNIFDMMANASSGKNIVKELAKANPTINSSIKSFESKKQSIFELIGQIDKIKNRF